MRTGGSQHHKSPRKLTVHSSHGFLHGWRDLIMLYHFTRTLALHLFPGRSHGSSHCRTAGANVGFCLFDRDDQSSASKHSLDARRDDEKCLL